MPALFATVPQNLAESLAQSKLLISVCRKDGRQGRGKEEEEEGPGGSDLDPQGHRSSSEVPVWGGRWGLKVEGGPGGSGTVPAVPNG